MSDRRPFTITNVHRDPEHGYWRARLTCASGEAVEVDRRYGAWFATRRVRPGARTFVRVDVTAPVAAALQARVRTLELAENRETTTKETPA